MTSPKLSAEYLRSRLHYDAKTGDFTWLPCEAASTTWNKRYAGTQAGTADQGYVRIYICGRMWRAHRLAWLYVYGELPSGGLDHRDLNKSNNAIGNLRLADQSHNAANARVRSSNRARLKGVNIDHRDGRISASIYFSGRKRHLGTFASIEDAHAAYCEAAKRQWGEFSNSGRAA